MLLQRSPQVCTQGATPQSCSEGRAPGSQGLFRACCAAAHALLAGSLPEAPGVLHSSSTVVLYRQGSKASSEANLPVSSKNLSADPAPEAGDNGSVMRSTAGKSLPVFIER